MGNSSSKNEEQGSAPPPVKDPEQMGYMEMIRHGYGELVKVHRPVLLRLGARPRATRTTRLARPLVLPARPPPP